MTNAQALERGSAVFRNTLRWQHLYWIGGLAAVIAALVFRRNIGAEVSLFDNTPLPSSAEGWFAILQENALLGLAYLSVFDLANYALLAVMYIALFAALMRTNAGLMLLALCLGLVGAGVYFASNQAFAIWNLSERYATATTDAERTLFAAAGEALLAIENAASLYQGSGVYVSLFLVTLAGLLSSIVMLQSQTFNQLTGWVGIVANALVLGHYPALAFAPDLTFLPHTLAAIPIILWQLLIARSLFRLARQEHRPEAS